MSSCGALRRTAGALLARLSTNSSSSSSGGGIAAARGSGGAQQQLQQARGNHDLSAHTNKHVEAWLARREDIDAEFVWDGRTAVHVIMGVLVVPGLIYNGVVSQAHKDDDYAGRPRRCAFRSRLAVRGCTWPLTRQSLTTRLPPTATPLCLRCLVASLLLLSSCRCLQGLPVGAW